MLIRVTHKSTSVSCLLESDCEPLCAQVLNCAPHHLVANPLHSVTDEEQEGNLKLSILITPLLSSSFDKPRQPYLVTQKGPNHYLVQFDHFDDSSITSVLSVLRTALKRICVLSGAHNLHAGAVVYQDKAGLLFAERGRGKTTTIINLLRTQVWGFLANDQCTIKWDEPAKHYMASGWPCSIKVRHVTTELLKWPSLLSSGIPYKEEFPSENSMPTSVLTLQQLIDACQTNLSTHAQVAWAALLDTDDAVATPIIDRVGDSMRHQIVTAASLPFDFGGARGFAPVKIKFDPYTFLSSIPFFRIRFHQGIAAEAFNQITSLIAHNYSA